MPPRRSRGAARAVITPMRTPTPAAQEQSDEEMVDGEESRVESQQEDEEEGEEDGGTPAQESDGQQASDRSSPREVQPFPRKRRLGRPPKNRPSDWPNTDPNTDGGSDRGTPQRRRRGRPSTGGFRGRPRGGPSHVTRVPIDKEGNTVEVIDDEVALPEDPEGEQKVDKLGNLLGGRDYRVRVFTIMGRGERKYMLSTEPARCTGFRDSYLFFNKHMQLYKIIVEEAEKRDLIARDIIPHSYKGRAIGVVTARSVFREFGARIIIGGKKVIDDYYAQAARDRGDVEGEIADPNDKLPPPSEPYNKNQYVAWHGASSVYHTGVPSVPVANGKVIPGKRKLNITSANWQFEHARAASRYNSALAASRRFNLEGVYDPHTNLVFLPKIMQPSHAKWEEVLPPQTGNGPASSDRAVPSIFSPVPPVVSRNFLITDIQFVSPPIAGLGVPGPDGDFHDTGINGLANLPSAILEELPAECRQAFENAKMQEREWKSSFGTESHDGARAQLKIGFAGVPV
ncbi:hypothetical protein W97_07062 [Coniosporium apollinis CBS 100218]|uniref:Chromatin structure-remodeling complex protein RSC7 n=1 Tax=Coniosporium apollinis (strain CBS 100218) TaxID=1168221 RepID=R7Z0W9_CONA1|nr:uncharacterized protein W97_07062 [Coniosporium apollinis CBS 100218]EON67807.1 hypothetical protein W97_07062 [Coniosporium apollinis CBS 100218]